MRQLVFIQSDGTTLQKPKRKQGISDEQLIQFVTYVVAIFSSYGEDEKENLWDLFDLIAFCVGTEGPINVRSISRERFYEVVKSIHNAIGQYYRDYKSEQATLIDI